MPDIVEGNDFNLNGIADDNVTLTGLDTDGDGLDNRFDSLNSVTNIKGTSYRMGNGGSFTGDATPGSRTTVQKTMLSQTDRDWRFVGYVLPVQFLNFNVNGRNNTASLSWTIIADKEIAYFELERKTPEHDFASVATIRQSVAPNTQQMFSYDDNITDIDNDIIYYRLKVIGKDATFKYSNILVLKKVQTVKKLSVLPNPAKTYAQVSFYADKNADVIVYILSSSGKLMQQQTAKVVKGKNLILLNGLAKYSNGFYMLQVVVNKELFTEKLILIN